MMKIVVVFAVLCGFSAAYSLPAPNVFKYYERPMGYRTVQRTMYGLHFKNQHFRNQRVSDFAPGVPLNDCQHTYVNSAEPSIQDSIAEPTSDAYPSEQFPEEEGISQEDPVIYKDEAADEPSSAPDSPAVAPAMIPKKKSRTVPAQVDPNEEEEQDASTTRRDADDSGVSNAFFPINFGSASGGAIAIANSYSTGEGGSAVSTATAYGSPATNEMRGASVSQLKKMPTQIRGRQ